MTFSTIATLAVALLSEFGYSTPAGAIERRQLKFSYGQEKVRGVNLGGLFVLEPWITPSIFDATPENVVDEYTFCQTLGKEEAKRRLEEHWNTFYTEADFALMKQYGLNTVRVPIGWWAVAPVDGEPYVQGAYDHLADIVNWAGNNGLTVMIDLHGAQFSQNGFDNSGKRGPVGWTQGDSIKNTHAALNRIRDDYANNPAVSAIELLNEPMGPQLDMNVVRQFYYDGWGDLRNSPVAVVVHDAFEGVTSWNDFGAGMQNLVLDTHHYEVFSSGELSMNPGQHINTACGFGAQMASNNKWTIAGEWSGAQTDCAKYLNGRGVGARYDGSFNKDGQGSYYIGNCDRKTTGTVEGLSSDEKNNIKQFIAAQIAAYEKAAGWIFWCWKNEAAPEWHFRDLVKAGLVPQPIDSQLDACG